MKLANRFFFKILITFFSVLLQVPVMAQNFYKDIKPIILKNCSPCHRPGEAAPFSLLTYTDVAKRTNFIKKVVSTKYMPPWKANNSYVHFGNDRSLSDNEIKTIVNWVNKGAKEGKQFVDDPFNQLRFSQTAYVRNPDLKLGILDTFLLKGDNRERFVEFKIPFELASDFNVEAVEFYSNNKKIIHHANYAIQMVEDRKIQLASPPSYINYTDGTKYYVDPYKEFKENLSYYGGWIPGSSYESYPNGIGWSLSRRGVVLLTVHYTPSAIDEKSVCGVNLFFTKNPIERKVKVVSFGSGGLGELDITPMFFKIPPNKESTYTLKFTNPSEDCSLLYIWPHMHFIGKEFKAYLTTTDNDTIPLIHIPQWDYRWQEMYRFKNFLKIPKGAVVHMECTYDNTSQNPHNPFNPPQDVYSYGGMTSTQEMMTMLFIYIPYQTGDENLSTSNMKEIIRN
ncbi:Copper type II ascorbate-dependent monooxygenase, C-terminal domain [bacterium A37T11]|nr:Copper type II ascorbate-dependent monooxygenase, C-terminal domain [bacterium A37T11]